MTRSAFAILITVLTLSPVALADGTPASCASIQSNDCFSNDDCSLEKSCQNLGTREAPLACCAEGKRGTMEGGQACKAEADCKSSVCVETPAGGLCSQPCDAMRACPTNMNRCVAIEIQGVLAGWCFPG